MSITLEIAEKNLQKWLEAESKLCHIGTYQIGERTLTYRNLKEVRESIDYWQSKVNCFTPIFFSCHSKIHKSIVFA